MRKKRKPSNVNKQAGYPVGLSRGPECSPCNVKQIKKDLTNKLKRLESTLEYICEFHYSDVANEIMGELLRQKMQLKKELSYK